VRLIDVSGDLPPQEVKVADMPTDAASHAGKSSIADRSHSGRLVGSEGKRVLIRQYARAVDEALRPLLRGDQLPLVLVAPEPINSIFRNVCSYPHLLDAGIVTNGEEWKVSEVGTAIAEPLKKAQEQRSEELAELIEQRKSQQRVMTDLADVARAASIGAIDTFIVDRSAWEAGHVDSAGELTLGGDTNVIDQIAGRVIQMGGRVLALPADEMPTERNTALLRYAL
jgi:hypothetical protein